ncbi:hypothetical protein ACEWY4_017455 [Coilia grayii]|uniref:NACHT, LRR and PYD domains-containing protein 12-like n=1 Tax=Coilia grayii TaxID=363190 RepID=A0ABD1JGW3_9TELE
MDPAVDAALKEVLRNTLDNLTGGDFKRFKHYLWDQGQISWRQLEKADTDDTVDLMVQVYTSGAGGIMLSILQKMNHNQLAECLERDLGRLRAGEGGVVHGAAAHSGGVKPSALSGRVGETSVPQHGGGDAQTDAMKKSLIWKLKRRLKNRFSVIRHETGECKLQDAYIELYIVEGRTGGVSTEHEVSAISMRQIGSRQTLAKQKHLDDMFSGEDLMTVLTLGIAGVGKTFAVQKFVTDWVENTSHNIDFVFLLLFRELNIKKEKGYSFFDLLLKYYPDLKELRKLPEFTECKLLFIFDGLDESRLQLDFDECISELDKESSVSTLVASLIAGQLLPSAHIWVTTRPAAANLIPRDYFNLLTEVRGFNDPQKCEFFQKNMSSPEKANTVIIHVTKNRSLHIMCHIPVFCHIISIVLGDILDNQREEEPPKTLTEVYASFSVHQINKMNRKYSRQMEAEEKRQLLLKLGRLAFKHLEEGTLVFYERDLQECDIDAKSGVLESGVCTQIFKAENSITDERIFSFVHLSVQEFLAALYALNEGVNGNNPLTTEEISSVSDLYKSAVEKALQSPNGHLDLFVRFLLGLASVVSQRVESPLRKLLPQLAVAEEIIESTVDYIKWQTGRNNSAERTINLFHCLNELGDNSLVEEISRYRNSTDGEGELTPGQCSALAYLLLMSAEDLEEFDLKKYRRSEVGLHRMLPVVKISRRVWLKHCHLSKASCDMMASVLQGTSSPLRELDMSDNDLQDEGVELLCVGLRHPQCKLQTLRLKQCHLSKASCDRMASVLQGTSSPLRELDMSDNDLQDEGVELLCVGLRHPQCKLQTLRLDWCHLSKASCDMMASVLQGTSSPLRELDMSDNDLQDEGVELLCVGLRHPQCKLQTLRLNQCHLSKASCDMMASVLQGTSSPLRELDMSDNDLQDEGVELLCVGLRHPQCKLETLRLSGCQITHKGCSFLASALKSNPSYLKELELSYNHPGDSGVRELTDRLNDPKCKLETLRCDHGGECRLKPGPRKCESF